jgi:pimeloyl-ACP methyl ester carboxylesterase
MQQIFEQITNPVWHVVFPGKPNHINPQPYQISVSESPYNNNNSDKNPFVIIYSHGNLENLQDIEGRLNRLSTLMKCNVYSYDYYGYGDSSGEQTNERNVCAIIECVVNNIKRQPTLGLEASIENGCGFTGPIIFWGRSIGSIPTLHAAMIYPSILTVLESALYSFWTEATGGFQMHNLGIPDPLNNAERVKNLQTDHLFIVHGDKDQVIPTDQGEALYNDATCEKSLCIIRGAGHNNIDVGQFIEDILNIRHVKSTPSFIEILKRNFIYAPT